jgi:pyrroloquinoline quinone (PQQ) biosynthesis protein C
MSTPTSPVPHLMACFEDTADRFHLSAPMVMLSAGRFGLGHYREYLRQVFHHTRDNPGLMALAASRLRGQDRELGAWWLKHALEEQGHDQWALQDLAHLGDDVSDIPWENPLPSTWAMHAFASDQIQRRGALGHLGYLWFLEFLPTRSGDQYMALLAQQGVPEQAMSFLIQHARIDQHHTQQLCRYADRMVRSQADLDLVCQAMQATGRVYEDFLRGVIEQAEAPRARGINPAERARA